MLHIDIEQEDERWSVLDAHLNQRVEESLRAAFAETDFASYLDDDAESELSLLLSDDAHVRDLNKTYRGKDRPTNVLSFPGEKAVAGLPIHFGDIIIAYDVVMREAEEQKKAPINHLLHLCVHGCLHLLDYDHIRDDDAEIMENLERQILKTLGISDPYADMKQVEHS